MEKFMGLLRDSVGSLPPVAGALLALLAGILASNLAKYLVSRVLELLKFDTLSSKIGLSTFLRKGNVQYSPSKLAGVLSYWLVLLFSLYRSAAALNIAAANAVAERLRLALPGIVFGLIVMAIGVVLASFTANFAVTIARNAGMGNPAFMGRIIKYVGNTLMIVIALEQMGFAQTILSQILVLGLAAAAFGLALAFGLGCKEMARKAAEDFLRNWREKERASRGADMEG